MATLLHIFSISATHRRYRGFSHTLLRQRMSLFSENCGASPLRLTPKFDVAARPALLALLRHITQLPRGFQHAASSVQMSVVCASLRWATQICRCERECVILPDEQKSRQRHFDTKRIEEIRKAHGRTDTITRLAGNSHNACACIILI